MRIDSGFIPLQVERPAGSSAGMRIDDAGGLSAGTRAPSEAESGSFADALREALERVNETQHQADLAVRRVATGEADELHEAIIALEKADLTLRLTAQVTQRAVEAYREISRMQI
jgi:flagellar hook-basal body complex protein FliE